MVIAVIFLALVHLYFIYKMLAIGRNKKYYFRRHKMPRRSRRSTEFEDNMTEL